MAGPTVFTPFKEFLGVAPEETPGTPVEMIATIPFEKVDFEDKVKWLDDPSLRGSMAELYGRYQGPREVEFSIEGPVYADTLPFLLDSILGDRTTSGDADPYTHAISLNNSASGQPITHTFTWYTGITADVGARVYPGACLSELTIEYDAEGGGSGGGGGGGGGGGKGGGGGGRPRRARRRPAGADHRIRRRGRWLRRRRWRRRWRRQGWRRRWRRRGRWRRQGRRRLQGRFRQRQGPRQLQVQGLRVGLFG